MAEENGKAVEIARLYERIDALKEDLKEYKESEKEQGKHTSSQISDLYKKSEYNLKAINGLNGKLIKVTSTIGGLVTALTLALKFLV